MQNAQFPRPFLMLPHRLFVDAPMPADAVAPAGCDPLPFVWCYGSGRPNRTQCKPLKTISGQTTSPDSHTKIAKSVEKLSADGKELRIVRRCSKLNDRLFNYADPNGPGVRPDEPIQQYQIDLYQRIYGIPWNPDDGGPGMTTAGPAGRTVLSYPYSPGQRQYDMAARLSGWFMQHASGDKVKQVQCEVSTQDQVSRQLLVPVALLLQARYGFNAPVTSVSEPAVARSQPAGDNLGPAPNTIDVNIDFPKFGRSTHPMHSVGTLHRDPDDPESEAHHAAGFPDFVLCQEYLTIRQAAADRESLVGRRHGYNFVAEVKTFWTVKDKDYEDIAFVVNPVTGNFNWKVPPDKKFLRTWLLVKQIWGESFFFQSNWGMSTNGKTVIFFVKLDDNTLVFGEPMGWTDEHLMQTLLGICLASIDENLRGLDFRTWMCAGYDAEVQP